MKLPKNSILLTRYVIYNSQTERKRHARKDRVYQHVQTQIADQAIARKAKKITKEDKVSCATTLIPLSSQVFSAAKPGAVCGQGQAGSSGAGGERYCRGCEG